METFLTLLALCVGIHGWPVNSKYPIQTPVTQGFDVSLICVRTSRWINNGDADDLRRHRAHYDVTIMRRGYLGESLSCHKGHRRSILFENGRININITYKIPISALCKRHTILILPVGSRVTGEINGFSASCDSVHHVPHICRGPALLAESLAEIGWC